MPDRPQPPVSSAACDPDCAECGRYRLALHEIVERYFEAEGAAFQMRTIAEDALTATPTADEVYGRLQEEWDALGLVSFTRDAVGVWRADLGRDDVKKIRALLRAAAATIEAYS